MNKRIIILTFTPLLSLLLSAAILAQNPSEPQVEFLGEVKQGKYQNVAYGFEFNVPAGWYVASPGDVDTVKRFTKEGLKDYKIRMPEKSTAENISLMITRDAIGTVKNAALGFSVMKQPSSKITPAMIADATKPMFVGKNGTSLKRDITSEMIGEKRFSTFDLLVESTLGKQYVRIYVTMVGENAITFALTYWEDSERELLENSIRSIRFTK